MYINNKFKKKKSIFESRFKKFSIPLKSYSVSVWVSGQESTFSVTASRWLFPHHPPKKLYEVIGLLSATVLMYTITVFFFF